MTAPGDSAPAESGLLRVNDTIAIPRTELEARASRAGGTGGQHVNTSSTRVELRWNVATSRALDDPVRARLLEKLVSRIDADGTLRVTASNRRSQLQNRELAEERMVELLREALVVRKSRRKTSPSRAARQKRLDEKKRNSEVKKGRGGRWE